jgi:transcriptional regulator with XRE-family HTH domain
MNEAAEFIPNPAHPLKATFKSLGFTQKQLAHFCGVSFQTLFQMLNGYRCMNKTVEKKLLYLLSKIRQQTQQ